MDAKEAALIAKKYFTETKTHHYFLFETSKVEQEDRMWVVSCEIKDLFDEEWKKYTVIINDEDGTILDVNKYD